jgi:phenol 2-monooxygenase (NADPH)
MKISMQDSHNLSWKLAYAFMGLTPKPCALLATYETESRATASKVVFFDKRWNQSDVPQEQKILEAKEQIFRCGAEYESSLIVEAKAEDEGNDKIYTVTGTAYIDGILRTGRRLLNVQVRRFADGTMWDGWADWEFEGCRSDRSVFVTSIAHDVKLRPRFETVILLSRIPN